MTVVTKLVTCIEGYFIKIFTGTKTILEKCLALIVMIEKHNQCSKRTLNESRVRSIFDTM